MKIPWASFGYIRPRDFRLNVLHEEMHHSLKLICNDHCQEINFAKNHHKLFNCI